MRQAVTTLRVATQGRGLVEITDEAARWTAQQGMHTGLLTLFCRHTSASLTIQENAASAVRDDLEAWMERAVPESTTLYAHDDEGPDDMPAHIRAMLTGVNLAVPLVDGRLALGTWQGVYLFEHRRRPHRREVALHLLGE